MPATRTLTSDQRKALEALFPGPDLVLAPEEMLAYGVDSSRRAAMPLAVVRPREAGQVNEFMRFAQAERLPVYVRSRGTNMVGATVPDPPGLVLSVLRLNRILEVDDRDFVAVVEPGVVTADLQKAATAKNLFYPPDPASLKISTLGGNVSTCAGGMRAVKYGVTRDYVLGLEAVLPGGETIRTGGRTHKNVVGLDLTRLLVGSAGTLAVVTRIILKLLPRPEATASLLACYASLEEALAGSRAVFGAGILPTALELLDGSALSAVAAVASVPWPAGAGAALLFRLDGSAEALDADLRRLRRVVEASGPTHLEQGRGAAEEEPLWDLRRMVSPASFRLGPDKISEDIAVPRGRTAEAIAGFKAIGGRFGLHVVCYGHLGDGNIHVSVMYDAADPAGVRDAHRAVDAIFDLTLSLGGTLSGEHGVGLSKLPWLDRQIGPTERALMRALKQAFDPLGILNPGKAY